MAKTDGETRRIVREGRQRERRVEERRLTGSQCDESLLTSRELLYTKSLVALRVERNLKE